MRTTLRAAVVAQLLATVAGSAMAQGSTTTAAAPGTIKVGYVNTGALMDAAPGKRAADSVYQKEAEAFATQQKVWSDSLRKMFASYQAEAPKLTDAQKQ